MNLKHFSGKQKLKNEIQGQNISTTDQGLKQRVPYVAAVSKLKAVRRKCPTVLRVLEKKKGEMKELNK